MAAEVGVSASSVRRVWKRHGLKPHLVRTFKVSNDPKSVEKLEDVVGLYMNPPEHALVLSVDEKSQIQALEKSNPSAGSNAAGPSVEEGSLRNNDPRLQAARDDDIIRGS